MIVLHLLQSNKYSGAENIVCQIIDLFKNDKDVRMIYVCQEGPIKSVLERKRIEYVLLDEFTSRKITAVVKKVKPDIIHAHDFTASIMAARCLGVPVISHIHCNPLWLQKINLKTIIYAISSWRYRKILGVSSAVKDEYIFSKCIEKKFVVLGNVINKQELYSKLQYANPVENIDLLFVGRLTEPKNPFLFLEIVRELKVNGYQLKCAMIGDGELKEVCEKYIKENKLDENIQLFGFLDNPYIYMKQSKLLVMPSKWEGFGLVAVESMLLGTPVICSGVGGLSNIVTEGSGYICLDKQEYIEKIIRLLDDSILYKSFSTCAIETAEKYTDAKTYKESIWCCYNDVLK